jgi:diguanylate cyclase (GGDEF)-like protein
MREKRQGDSDDAVSMPDLKDLNLSANSLTVLKNSIYIYRSELNWYVGLDNPILSAAESVRIIQDNLKITYPVYHQLLEREKKDDERDYLTGLFSRKKYFTVISADLKKIQVNKLPLYLFYMDFNNFKAVNDVLGHDMGDRVLISLSAEIRNVFSGFGNVFRLGGDEFVGVSMGISDDKAAYIKSMLEKVAEQHPCGMYVNISVGMIKITDDMINPRDIKRGRDKLIENFMSLAEADMYAGKKNKKPAVINCDKCSYRNCT